MGHLPLPSSSTATVKRRGGLPPDRERWEREAYPAPLFPTPVSFLIFIASEGNASSSVGEAPGTDVSRPALPPPP
ncbi:unnamed protein product [Lasius platythorax]|uniref:Uncharacterized protein n=1 Tax=Lasius platythorax TaxID=488582 RepID=A0AAV2NDM9_9HYME